MKIDQDDVEVLINYGHSAAKAAEIALDKARGDRQAALWVEYLRKTIGGMRHVDQ